MPAIIIGSFILVTVVLRLIFSGAELLNYVPVAAMALCAGLFIRQLGKATLVALGGLLISDVLLNLKLAAAEPETAFWSLTLSPAIWTRYLFYGAILIVAWRCRRYRGPLAALVATPIGTLFFYVATNTVSWAGSQPPFVYAKTLAGWWQSQTIGFPQFPPSYLFLRNALIGDLLFTIAFLAIVCWMPQWRKQRLDAVTPSSGIPS